MSECLLHMPAGRGPCGHVHRYRSNACSHMAGAGHAWPHGRAHVDSVDHAKANCPHGPHACAGVFWRGRGVDNVDLLDRRFKSAAYNTVYRYCIHFYSFLIFIYILSTLSTKPLFHWRAMWANQAARVVRNFAHMVHKTLIGKVLSKIMLDNAKKTLTM